MLHVATVHYRSPRWIRIQTEHLRRHINVPMQIWTSLEGIDDYSLEIIERWPWKRSTMASILDEIAAARPKLIFLDILYTEPQEVSYVPQPDGGFAPLDHDGGQRLQRRAQGMPLSVFTVVSTSGPRDVVTPLERCLSTKGKVR